MGTIDKLIAKVLNGSPISYKEAERMLLKLGYRLDIKASHYIFRKHNKKKIISLKKRARLHSYQLGLLREVLKDHGY